MRNKPNLFLVGAMKSATTSLHNYLDCHPEIFMTQEPWKEPNFFVKELNNTKGINWYLSLFDEVHEEKYIGESSTDYTKFPNYKDAYKEIPEFSPNAKIIYIMRDPIERAVNQYWWEVQYSGEGRGMKSGILQNDWIMNTSYYAKQIKPYIELFGFDNVYTLTTEELIKNPNEVMENVFSWLGVSTDIAFQKENLKVHNKSGETVDRLIGSSIISKLKGGVFWSLLKRVIKPKYRSKLLILFSRQVAKSNEEKAAVIKALRPIMLPQVQELSELLGRDFPEWGSLIEK